MVIGIGTDIIEIERIKKAAEKPGFLERYFTPEELRYFCRRKNNPAVIAGNFAAKEAVSKALGTGFRGFSLREVAVLRDGAGKPYAVLGGQAAVRYEHLGGKSLHVSISHCAAYAAANAVLDA